MNTDSVNYRSGFGQYCRLSQDTAEKIIIQTVDAKGWIFKNKGREWFGEATALKASSAIPGGNLQYKTNMLYLDSLSHQKVTGMGQFYYLAYFWPFVKKILNSCCSRRQMGGIYKSCFSGGETEALSGYLFSLIFWNHKASTLRLQFTLTFCLQSCVTDQNCQGVSLWMGEAFWKGGQLKSHAFVSTADGQLGVLPSVSSLPPPTLNWQLWASSCLIKPQTENASYLLAWHLWILSSFYN